MSIVCYFEMKVLAVCVDIGRFVFDQLISKDQTPILHYTKNNVLAQSDKNILDIISIFNNIEVFTLGYQNILT